MITSYLVESLVRLVSTYQRSRRDKDAVPVSNTINVSQLRFGPLRARSLSDPTRFQLARLLITGMGVGVEHSSVKAEYLRSIDDCSSALPPLITTLSPAGAYQGPTTLSLNALCGTVPSLADPLLL